MISEHQFATHYSSAWHAVAPLSDGFWAIENLQVERVARPLHPRAPKGMRAIVNEAAFRTFCDLHPARNTVERGDIPAALNLRFQDAIDYVARFSNAPPVVVADIDDDCRKEAGSLVLRLLHYFSGQAPTVLRPRFSGCGLISACEGDLIEGTCLYEVKSGDRAFRILDLRQLLTYSALAYAARQLTFTEVGLLNPRRGVVWRRSLEDVCLSISGLRLSDTLSALVEQFSGASASR